jgi:hypothetical protein
LLARTPNLAAEYMATYLEVHRSCHGCCCLQLCRCLP